MIELESLKQKSLYNHETENIEIIQTIISIIALTGKYAYKIPKPVNLGFLDFTTLEQRKNLCYNEMEYNKLLSPDLYVDVVAITKDKEKISINGKGEIVDYAIKLKQIPQEFLASTLIKQNKINEHHIKEIASIINNFHQHAKTSKQISEFGKLKTIKFNWDENFNQTEKHINSIIPHQDFNFIKEKINSFISKNKRIFQERVKQNKIRHCHGDLHTGNIFITDKVHIFDAIVFNQRFPCSDTAADIAFMAMDLDYHIDYHKKPHLSNLFVEEYIKLSQDQDLINLLDFYKCYRAYVRGKINCFLTEDKNISQEQKNKAIEEAKKYFQLSKEYATNLN